MNVTTIVLWVAVGVAFIYGVVLFIFLQAHLPLFQPTLRFPHNNDLFGKAVHHGDLTGRNGPTALRIAPEVIPKSPSTIHSTQPLFSTPNKPKKYIIFVPIKEGQGIGNIMNGLLAAHLLGDEFGRRVCVSTEFKGFHLAFEPVEEGVLEECSQLPQEGGQQLVNVAISGNAMILFNYGVVPNECALRDLLASPTVVLFYCGNTYPRWPAVADKFFTKLYRPRQQLLDAMPWTIPPETVVHLRAPDPIGDRRQGLDDMTLRILGESLPHETFLVTNLVDWYDLFEKKYGWAHPEWEEISHSAVAITWGSRNVTNHSNRKNLSGLSIEDQKSLSMFCDWYTISQAKRVVHTHSDFSLSAIHFMNILNSQTIMGSEYGNLTLWEESWRRDGETPRLVDRTADNLRLC
jgi:hypothetical protein